MKRLLIIRHAKSSWDLAHRDIDRALEERGKTDAQLVALECRAHLPKTYVIHSSIGKRAYETALIFTHQFGYPPEHIIINEALYTFDLTTLESIVKALPDNEDNVILFGHNEAITNFVNKFGSVFIDNVPTSGFVSMQFSTNRWQSISKGRTIKTIFPKDLK